MARDMDFPLYGGADDRKAAPSGMLRGGFDVRLEEVGAIALRVHHPGSEVGFLRTRPSAAIGQE